jgi:transaldolase/glucose-6-phosphate isomerase
VSRPVEPAELVRRIWARDASVWTSSGEERWLGWLDAPDRELDRAEELLRDVAALPAHDDVLLLGMGGSSLAPEVFRRWFGADRFHVLDTTHPREVERVAARLDPARTLVLVSSKSGTTLETRCHADFFRAWAGGGERFVAVTDPGSELERVAAEQGFAAVFHGVPSIGGRYSALSPFGLVPAALQGVAVERLLERALEAAEACRLPGEGNPGLELGLALGEGWREGRDKVCMDAANGFGLWLEQLLAESTGKDGKGLVPAPGETGEGDDRQWHELRLPDAYELGAEMFRWEFAVAVAGQALGIDPFDQPDVQAAKDRTVEVLGGDAEPALEPVGSVVRATTWRSRRSSTRPARATSPRSPSGGARPGASSRSGSAHATCTRRASCTRAARTRASTCRWSTTPATRFRSRTSRSASGACWPPRPRAT